MTGVRHRATARAAWRTFVVRWRHAWALLVLLPSVALGQQNPTFDHLATGFALLGAHETVRCETCHIKAIFKGTPRDCDTCHVQNNQRGAVAKPFDHIQTQPTEHCDSCHTVVSFSSARFNHALAVPGDCASCHNGVRAVGRPVGHIQTTLSCDQCHGTIAFAPVKRFDHSALGGDLTTCASCHDGRIATGKPANHLPGVRDTLCGSCHIASTQNGFTSFAGGQMDHAGIASGCATCHGPGLAAGAFAGITSIVTMPADLAAWSDVAHPVVDHLRGVPPCQRARRPSAGVGGTPAAGQRIRVAAAECERRSMRAVTTGCSTCHDASFVWMGVSAYPIAPSSIVPNAQYTGFQTRPTARRRHVRCARRGASIDRRLLRSATRHQLLHRAGKPANHIPTAASAQCTACHTSSDFSVMPTLANIHANAPSTTNNCAQCHGAAAPSFAIPAANFASSACRATTFRHRLRARRATSAPARAWPRCRWRTGRSSPARR